MMTVANNESEQTPESFGALLREIKQRIRAAQYAIAGRNDEQIVCGVVGNIGNMEVAVPFDGRSPYLPTNARRERIKLQTAKDGALPLL